MWNYKQTWKSYKALLIIRFNQIVGLCKCVCVLACFNLATSFVVGWIVKCVYSVKFENELNVDVDYDDGNDDDDIDDGIRSKRFSNWSCKLTFNQKQFRRIICIDMQFKKQIESKQKSFEIEKSLKWICL